MAWNISTPHIGSMSVIYDILKNYVITVGSLKYDESNFSLFGQVKVVSKIHKKENKRAT